MSRKVVKLPEALKDGTMPKLQLALSESRHAITDMWTGDFKKVAYTTAVVHYTDSNRSMRCRVMFTRDFPMNGFPMNGKPGTPLTSMKVHGAGSV